MISNILNLNQKGNFKKFDHFHREYIFAVPPVFAAPEPLRVLRRAERDPPVPWESTQCAAQCPGRAHSTVPVHFGRAAADRQSTLPGPFLTCVVSHCCLIGKYFDLRSSLCNANIPFYKWFHILNWRVSFGRRVSGGSLDVQENPQQTKMAAQPLIGA